MVEAVSASTLGQAELFGNARYTEASAILSDCGAYRYQLERRWANGLTVLWVMLNPSTADGRQDDRTIGRCVDFSKRWGFGGLLVGNLFALRATDPDELLRHADPVGPLNAWNLSLMCIRASRVVVAWGSHPAATKATFQDVYRGVYGKRVICLGRTKGGAPRHPLYVPASFEPQEFRP